MRYIALDTETTGLTTEQGHRIIEIGCVELIDRTLGNTFHCYLQPEREIDAAAEQVHGISNKFLVDKPKFKEVMAQFIAFIDGAELIIHNAPFDVGFLNYEFSLCGYSRQVQDHCEVFDSLVFARRRHPGQKNSLDALCKRYEINNTHRQFHGALLDATLLAKLYCAMTGGQSSLFTVDNPTATLDSQQAIINKVVRRHALPIAELSIAEQQDHQQFVEFLTKTSGVNLWQEQE